MKSGIYSLTFKNGSKYIGKTVNFDRRWREHADKLAKGTAAQALQQTYDRYGMPKARIVKICHPDHIDLLESYYICKMLPELNTVGGVVLTGDELQILEDSELLLNSTVEHLRMIDSLGMERDNLSKELAELKDVNILSKKLEAALNKIEELEVDLAIVTNKPWWKRWLGI